MFTGLVEEVGRVVALEKGEMLRIGVRAGRVAGDAREGDSVAVNGACLTVGAVSGETLYFHAMPETLRRTSLGALSEGAGVNLERAMGAHDRFGGHIVQGHVDGVGEVLEVTPEGDAEIWEFAAPPEVLRYIIEKGSVCVDGISLTVVSVGERSFTVSILPQTKTNTNLREKKVGDRVNLEADVIGKYVERLLGPRFGAREATLERSIEDAV